MHLYSFLHISVLLCFITKTSFWHFAIFWFVSIFFWELCLQELKMRVSSTEGWKWISSCDHITHFNFRTNLQVEKSCFSLLLQLFVMTIVSLNKVKLNLVCSTPWPQSLGRGAEQTPHNWGGNNLRPTISRVIS